MYMWSYQFPESTSISSESDLENNLKVFCWTDSMWGSVSVREMPAPLSRHVYGVYMSEEGHIPEDGDAAFVFAEIEPS